MGFLSLFLHYVPLLYPYHIMSTISGLLFALVFDLLLHLASLPSFLFLQHTDTHIDSEIVI